MKKLVLVLPLVFMLAVNTSVLGQVEEEEERDVLEVVGFFGAAIPTAGVAEWMSPGGPEIGAKPGIGFGGGIGYFVTGNLVLGVNFTYSQHSLDTQAGTGNLEHRFYNPSLYLKRYFYGESDLVPYVKVHVGLDNPKFTTWVWDEALQQFKFRELSYDPALAFGAGVGLFYYTSDYSGLLLEANLHYGLSEDAEGTFQDRTYRFGESNVMIDVHAGVKVFFGSGE
ncbi:MAG TPA: hypothetical protein VMY05_03985 [Acidobacteriota bacterium]|nr:hypothetical protein [Acidobacteriota bacterium]